MSIDANEQYPSVVKTMIERTNTPRDVTRFAPPSHPDRERDMDELAAVLEQFKNAAKPRLQQIAILIAELPVHEALEMADEIVKQTIAMQSLTEEQPARLMFQLNAWSRSKKENAATG